MYFYELIFGLINFPYLQNDTVVDSKSLGNKPIRMDQQKAPLLCDTQCRIVHDALFKRFLNSVRVALLWSRSMIVTLGSVAADHKSYENHTSRSLLQEYQSAWIGRFTKVEGKIFYKKLRNGYIKRVGTLDVLTTPRSLFWRLLHKAACTVKTKLSSFRRTSLTMLYNITVLKQQHLLISTEI